MTYTRRELMHLLAGAFACAAGGRAVAAPGTRPRRPVVFPPFELQATPSTLRALTSDITGWHVEGPENLAFGVWLLMDDGAVWLMTVDDRPLGRMFEVFTLAMRSMDELRAQWERWQPMISADAVPEPLRGTITTRPPAPAAPERFEPWPLRNWRTQVVRRAEFVMEGEDALAAAGDNPGIQSAARPLAVPPEAAASCEVAAGLLFTGEDGRRLLLAIDWLPMNILVMNEDRRIDEYLASCELVEVEAYLQRLAATP